MTQLGFDGNRAAQAIGERADMGQADAFARLVLLPRTSEQIEDALMVARVDAPAIVAHRHDHPARRLLRGDMHLGGARRVAVFGRILDQVGQDLFQRDVEAATRALIG